jgi:hypothetical protein
MIILYKYKIYAGYVMKMIPQLEGKQIEFHSIPQFKTENGLTVEYCNIKYL